MALSSAVKSYKKQWKFHKFTFSLYSFILVNLLFLALFLIYLGESLPTYVQKNYFVSTFLII